MKAYLIALISISDREQYAEYLKAVPAIVQKYEGKVLVKSENVEVLEGTDEYKRIVVLEFPSLKNARQFYQSAEYTEAKKLRRNAATGELILTEGAQ